MLVLRVDMLLRTLEISIAMTTAKTSKQKHTTYTHTHTYSHIQNQSSQTENELVCEYAHAPHVLCVQCYRVIDKMRANSNYLCFMLVTIHFSYVEFRITFANIRSLDLLRM